MSQIGRVGYALISVTIQLKKVSNRNKKKNA